MNEFATAAIIKSDEAFRETPEKGVAQAKDTFARAKAAIEQATDIFKDTYATAARGATEYNLKIIEIACTNTTAAFEHAQQLLGVKSSSEFVELSIAHAREQFETMIAQTRELTELAQKMTIKISEPLKAGIIMASKKVA
jgi:phasin